MVNIPGYKAFSLPGFWGRIKYRSELERLYIDVLSRGYKIIKTEKQTDTYVITAQYEIVLLLNGGSKNEICYTTYRLMPNDKFRHNV